jgi:hypothetical protein
MNTSPWSFSLQEEKLRLQMPERDGYKTLDLIAQELGVGERKVRQAIDELKIEPTTFRIDQRFKYYSQEDVKRIKSWLLEH